MDKTLKSLAISQIQNGERRAAPRPGAPQGVTQLPLLTIEQGWGEDEDSGLLAFIEEQTEASRTVLVDFDARLVLVISENWTEMQ